MIANPPRCIVCKNYIAGTSCKAFPIEIPPDVFSGIKIHVKPLSGDNGILFEPTEKAKEFFKLFPGR